MGLFDRVRGYSRYGKWIYIRSGRSSYDVSVPIVARLHHQLKTVGQSTIETFPVLDQQNWKEEFLGLHLAAVQVALFQNAALLPLSGSITDEVEEHTFEGTYRVLATGEWTVPTWTKRVVRTLRAGATRKAIAYFSHFTDPGGPESSALLEALDQATLDALHRYVIAEAREYIQIVREFAFDV